MKIIYSFSSLLIGMILFSCSFQTSKLDVNGDLKIKIKSASKTAVLEESDYFVWGGSPIKGEDGLYHLFYNRWPKEYGFNSWSTHAEIAHAVSKNLLGPYKFKNLALSPRGRKFWDGTTTQNPTIKKWDGKYYLYYTGMTGDQQVQYLEKDVHKRAARGCGVALSGMNMSHRNNQRVGVAVAEDLDGPWVRLDKPIIDISADSTASDALCTTNPTITKMPNGKFLLIYKCVGKKKPLPFGGPVVHMAAFSDSPTGPFKKVYKDLFTDGKSNFACEDPFIWTQNDKVYAIVKDINGIFSGTGDYALVLFETENGIDWKLSKNSLISEKVIKWDDGTEMKVNNIERPALYIENGKPKAAFFAIGTTESLDRSFNLHVPIDVTLE